MYHKISAVIELIYLNNENINREYSNISIYFREMFHKM